MSPQPSICPPPAGSLRSLGYSTAFGVTWDAVLYSCAGLAEKLQLEALQLCTWARQLSY